MSAVTIVILIVIVLVVLTSYAFIVQTLAHKNEQKQRLITSLKSRVSALQYLLKTCPKDFLPHELKVLAHHCLIDAFNQLSQFEPDDQSYEQQRVKFEGKLNKLQQQPVAKSKPAILQNPSQMQEIRQHLKGLFSFIAHLEHRGIIDDEEAAAYRRQIKQLVLQLSVDAHIKQAQAAQSAGKIKLALHQYSLASRLLQKANGEGQYGKQMQKIEGIMNELASLIEQQPKAAAESSEKADEGNWDKKEESWKKKNVYD